MKPVILDSSALYSLASIADSNHGVATAISNTLSTQNAPLIVPGEVFTETINVLGKKLGRAIQRTVGDQLLATAGMTILETTPAIRRAAYDLLMTQPASVSLTDCFVMAFADEYHTTEIFGFDEVFKKNGYHPPEHERQKAA